VVAEPEAVAPQVEAAAVRERKPDPELKKATRVAFFNQWSG
jgi:hypothetical protein